MAIPTYSQCHLNTEYMNCVPRCSVPGSKVVPPCVWPPRILASQKLSSPTDGVPNTRRKRATGARGALHHCSHTLVKQYNTMHAPGTFPKLQQLYRCHSRPCVLSIRGWIDTHTTLGDKPSHTCAILELCLKMAYTPVHSSANFTNQCIQGLLLARATKRRLAKTS